MSDSTPEYDVFISHASEDRDAVARPLYEALVARGLRVWLDELELVIGDSLRTEIDRALSLSRFGVVVLSPTFFAKKWPGKELDGLTAIEVQRGKTILPVWHDVDHEEVLRYSPTLADRLAATTDSGIESVANDVVAALRKAGITVDEPSNGSKVIPDDTPELPEPAVEVDPDVSPVVDQKQKSGFFSRLNQMQGLFGLLAVVIGAVALYFALPERDAPPVSNAPNPGVEKPVPAAPVVEQPEQPPEQVASTPAQEPDSIEESTVNVAPVASRDHIKTDSKTGVTGSLFTAAWGGADYDPDGDRITVYSVNGSTENVGQPLTLESGATITIKADGDFVYDPSTGFSFLIKPGSSSADKVEYVILDDRGEKSEAVASMFSVKKRLDPGDTFQDCDDCPEMVVIPAGEFTMGSPDSEKGRQDSEGPQHPVTIGALFAMGRYEVTVGQFAAFVKEVEYQTEAEQSGGCWFWNVDEDKAKQDSDRNWQSPGFTQNDEHPVVCVTHNDAEAYVTWLFEKSGVDYRLPSEREWEYAARAGTETARYWGESSDIACAYANGADEQLKKTLPEWKYAIHPCLDRYDYTAPVTEAGFKANSFGLSHMLGNAWEWTADCWHDSYVGAPKDGTTWLESSDGDCDRRVLRGGGWLNLPDTLRAAFRNRFYRTSAYFLTGFRLARTL